MPRPSRHRPAPSLRRILDGLSASPVPERDLDASSKTTENLRRTGQCVLNLLSADMVGAVDAMARTTGSDPLPEAKQMRSHPPTARSSRPSASRP